MKHLWMKPEIEENNKNKIVCYVDSDWGGDTDTRQSTSGWIFFVDNCIIAWGSKAQKTVIMSSCTAEYVAITEAMKQVLYLRSIAEFSDIGILLPIRVLCDNMGAVFLSNNYDGKRTKYLETQYHFV